MLPVPKDRNRSMIADTYPPSELLISGVDVPPLGLKGLFKYVHDL